MTDLFELGSSLFGRRRAEGGNVLNDAATHTYVGTAVTDSEDGSVYVALSDDVTMPDDYDGEHGVGVEMPTSVAVSEGDEVMVTVFGGGTMKSPVVSGNPGWGDRVRADVAAATGIAEAAEAVANATGQHFWPDDDGVHVTEVTQEEWSDEDGASYHSGANVLLNSLGQLFRDGLNNLLALLPSGFVYYDGNGNSEGNVIVKFVTSVEDLFNRVTRISLGGDSFPAMFVLKGGSGSYMNRSVGMLVGDALGGVLEPVARLTVDTDDSVGRYDEFPSAWRYVNADADVLIVNGTPASMDNLVAALRVTSTQETTWAASNVSGSARPCRSNGIVCTTVGYDLTVTSALSSGNAVTIGTVPEGWRPLGTVVAPVVTDNVQSGRLWVYINASGTIRLHNYSGSSLATSTHLRFTLTYVI